MATYKTLIKLEDLQKAKKYISERIEIDSETGCHLWKLSKDKDGYGIGKWDRTCKMHRLSYAVSNNGVIGVSNEAGEKLVVRHSKHCTPACCNENHLEIGTYKQNADDRVDKGNAPIGENHPNSTISEETAKLIIASKYPKGHVLYLTQLERAIKFNTTVRTIGHIDTHSSWMHIPRKPDLPVEKKENRIKKRKDTPPPGEDRAKLIIASKKHKHDPEYLTIQERASRFSVSVGAISEIDNRRTWQYLPRPDIVEFNPPEFAWTFERAAEDFEKIKKHCKYTTDVNKFTGTRCLEWYGCMKGGRPIITIKNRTLNSYIFSCEFGSRRERNEGEHTRHLCNNKICCEPTHLKFGTYTENRADALRFGVSKNFKLSYEIARKIRVEFNIGIKTVIQLAEEFNVGETTIYSVINNISWNE